MKRFKILLSSFVVLLLVGCVDIAIDMTARNDDSGSISYTMAYLKSMLDGDDSYFDVETEEEMATEYEGQEMDVTVEAIEYEKDDATYVGNKITYEFTSLEDLNDFMQSTSDDEEASEDSDDVVSFSRSGDVVTVNMDSEGSEYASDMYTGSIDYVFTLQVEGKVLTNNATTFDENTNTLTWEFGTMIDEGISATYDTSEKVASISSGDSSSSIIYIVIGVALAGVIGFVVFKKIKK